MSHGNVTSCGNVTSHGNATFHGNSTSHLVKIVSAENFGILHVKYRVLPHVYK